MSDKPFLTMPATFANGGALETSMRCNPEFEGGFVHASGTLHLSGSNTALGARHSDHGSHASHQSHASHHSSHR